jgi:hypothetical protein
VREREREEGEKEESTMKVKEKEGGDREDIKKREKKRNYKKKGW